MMQKDYEPILNKYGLYLCHGASLE